MTTMLPTIVATEINGDCIESKRNNPSPISEASEEKKSKKAREDPTKPRRPLSAYNFFFKDSRERLLKLSTVRPEGKPRHSHGKIGFAELARTIASSWKNISEEEKAYYEELAKKDKLQYKRLMAQWKAKNELGLELALPQVPKDINTQAAYDAPITAEQNITPSPQPRRTINAAAAVPFDSFSQPTSSIHLSPEAERYYNERVRQFCLSERRRIELMIRRQRLQRLRQLEEEALSEEMGLMDEFTMPQDGLEEQQAEYPVLMESTGEDDNIASLCMDKSLQAQHESDWDECMFAGV